MLLARSAILTRRVFASIVDRAVEFILISFGLVAGLVLVLVLLARAYPGSGADLLDWKPTRSYETEAMLELDDVQQMIEAQNAYRRRRGAPELTEADAHRMADEDNAIREKARASYDKRLDELEDEFGA
jgi:hypothetical protein